MFSLTVLAALAAQAPEPTAAVADRQARAVVRILGAARVELATGATLGEQPTIVRETSIRDTDGTDRPAVLVEFS